MMNDGGNPLSPLPPEGECQTFGLPSLEPSPLGCLSSLRSFPFPYCRAPRSQPLLLRLERVRDISVPVGGDAARNSPSREGGEDGREEGNQVTKRERTESGGRGQKLRTARKGLQQDDDGGQEAAVERVEQQWKGRAYKRLRWTRRGRRLRRGRRGTE